MPGKQGAAKAATSEPRESGAGEGDGAPLSTPPPGTRERRASKARQSRDERATHGPRENGVSSASGADARRSEERTARRSGATLSRPDEATTKQMRRWMK